jgi:hypothetical protein
MKIFCTFVLSELTDRETIFINWLLRAEPTGELNALSGGIYSLVFQLQDAEMHFPRNINKRLPKVSSYCFII